MTSTAIIGTGISGLGAAYGLHSAHNITVYEAADTIGGHARTKTVLHGNREIAVDTGFIVFNYRNYPHLTALFDHLQVPVQKSDMTFGVTAHNGGLEWGAKDLNAVFGQRRNLLRPRFIRLLVDVFTFNSRGPQMAEDNPGLTLGELIAKLRLSQWFSDYYILPMGGAIWSCPLHTMLAFPAINFTRFFKAHGLLSVTGQPQWYTVTGGSQEYLKRLSAPFADKIRTRCAVTSVRRDKQQVHVSDATGEIRTYDQVVFACHADQALALLADATDEERAALGAFTYQKNKAVLHKDASVMPMRKSCWASWVYHPDGSKPTDPIAVTYWMNLLQNIDNAYPLFVTLNPTKPIAAEHIFDEHWFDHPAYSIEAVQAQQQITQMQGQNRSWFCGAHMRNGFHEDGLASAADVVKHMGVAIPWL